MDNYSKKTKNEINRLAELAHERELETALSDLYSKFKEWENNELTSFELNHEIHNFHENKSSEIFKRYNSQGMTDYFVAIAIVNGIIDKNEVAEEVYQELEFLIKKIMDRKKF